MLYSLLTLPHIYLAECILDRFTVRIHSRIVEKGELESRSWVRLWYLLRFIDDQGEGYIRIPLADVCQILAAGESTTYQWLREGRDAGAFRWWKVRRGKLRVALGGLFAVSRALGFKVLSDQEIKSQKKFNKAKGLPKNWGCKQGIGPWGVTAEVPVFALASLQDFRAIATAAVAQRLQQLSRYTAWASLPTEARQRYRLPQPDDYFQHGNQRRLSHDSAKGEASASSGGIRCLIHVGKSRIFVSKGHVCYGASQKAIAQERKICDRTVRRHLEIAGVESRQLVQTKAAYRLVKRGLEWDINVAPEPDITLRWIRDKSSLICEGSYTLTEPSGGRLGNPHTFEVSSNRFFKYGDHYYIYRCNLYQPSLKLSTMSAARRDFVEYSVLQKGRFSARRPCSIGGLNESQLRV